MSFLPKYSRAAQALTAFLLLLLPALAAERFKPFKLKSPDGAAHTLEDFRNKATLVGFFFPGCKFCNAAVPELQALYDRYKDQGLSMVWINVVPEQNKDLASWREKNRWTIPVLTGASQASLQRDYKLKMTPTHYLLNAGGEILFSQAGYKKGDEQKIEQQVRQALNLAP
jgi:thiol-disulfide isomerase/thioredoxin